MTPGDAALRLVRRYYDEVVAGRDLAVRDELFDPGFVGHSAGFGEFGLDAMRRSLEREQTVMPEDETVIEGQFAAGDRVVTRWRYRWKHERPVFGETPSGVWLEMEGAQIQRVAGGKIVELWEIKDRQGVMERLGGRVVFPESE